MGSKLSFVAAAMLLSGFFSPHLLAAGGGNFGTQLPLNQYQAGTEVTKPIADGTFEDGLSRWTTVAGNPKAITPINGVASDGSLAFGATFKPLGTIPAVAPAIENDTVYSFAPSSNPDPATNTKYFLSAYLWNFGDGPSAPGIGGFVSTPTIFVTIIDSASSSSTPPISGVIGLARTAADGGDGANGYFVYGEFDSALFPHGVDIDISTPGGSNNINGVTAQADNIAITPFALFQAPVHAPEPASISLFAIAGLGMLRRNRRA